MRTGISSFVLLTLIHGWASYAMAADKTAPPPESQVSSNGRARVLEGLKAETQSLKKLAVTCAVRAEGKPYTFENDGWIFIGNDRMAAVFSRKTLELAALVDVTRKGRLMAVGTGPLWILRIGNVGETLELTSSDSAVDGHRFEQGPEGVRLVLRWKKVAAPAEAKGRSVRVVVSARRESIYLHWRITVSPQPGQSRLWEVDFPRIDAVLPMGRPEETALLLPWGRGIAIPNPFGLNETFEGLYPTYLAPMQFSSVYGPAGGLFLGTFDGQMSVKRFLHECCKDDGVIRYTVRNLPENRGELGIGYAMPYDFVMTGFQGDWFTACRLYRRWALDQVWCSKGPVHQRQDIPDWFKQLGFWIIFWEKNSFPIIDEAKARAKGFSKPRVNDDVTADQIIHIAGTLDVPLAVHLYGWHRHPFDQKYPEFFPPFLGNAGFAKQIARLNDARVKVVPYVNGNMWDMGLPSFRKLDVDNLSAIDARGDLWEYEIDHTVQYERGQSREPFYHLAWVCPYTTFWQRRVTAISEELVSDYGAGGVYYDVLSGNARECFHPRHGHPKGGGNYWAKGSRAVLKSCREALREHDPQLVMTSENVTEVYLDLLDGTLLFGVHERPGTVPAFQAVYHDHCILFGNTRVGYKTWNALAMPVGEAFVSGDQLGWFNIWWIFLPEPPHGKWPGIWQDEQNRRKYIDFVNHLGRLRLAGLKFLGLGEMLEPLSFANKLPLVEERKAERVVRQMPAVAHSVWKAADGTIGIVFCNISHDEQRVEYTFNALDYGLPEGRSYRVVNRMVDGKVALLGESDSPVFKRVERIPALSGLALEVQFD